MSPRRIVERRHRAVRMIAGGDEEAGGSADPVRVNIPVAVVRPMLASQADHAEEHQEDQPSDQHADQPQAQLADQPEGQLADQPSNHPTDQSEYQRADQPADQHVDQSAVQPADQRDYQPTYQSVNLVRDLYLTSEDGSSESESSSTTDSSTQKEETEDPQDLQSALQHQGYMIRGRIGRGRRNSISTRGVTTRNASLGRGKGARRGRGSAKRRPSRGSSTTASSRGRRSPRRGHIMFGRSLGNPQDLDQVGTGPITRSAASRGEFATRGSIVKRVGKWLTFYPSTCLV